MTSKNSYDTHTLFIKCGCASTDQIRQSIGEALRDYQRSIGERLNCNYKVNLLCDREGNSFGSAFVFVTNPSVYYMLIGKNPDGSDRVEYIDDPSWQPPVEGQLTNDAGWSAVKEPRVVDFDAPVNWEDLLDDEDDEYFGEDNTAPAQCPKIAMYLDPLITLPPYELTEEQLEQKKQRIIDENTGKPDFDPSLVSVPKLAYIGVDRAMVVPLDRKFIPNILKTSNVPGWVSEQLLKEVFTPYASDKETKHERVIQGQRKMDTYPFVNINKDRVAFVIFDPKTNDGQFALHMTKKTPLSRTKDGQRETVTLIFGHSYCTDRDNMNNITDRPHVNNSKRGTGQTFNARNARARPRHR